MQEMIMLKYTGQHSGIDEYQEYPRYHVLLSTIR